MNLNKAFILFCVFFIGMLSANETLGSPDVTDIVYFDDEEDTKKQIELGKVLFFDPRLSENKKQSCATCHNPNLGFGDAKALGVGSKGNRLERNSPHLYNLAWNTTFMWDGRFVSLEEQALGPITSVDEMNLSLDELKQRLKEVPWYVAQFKSAYPEGGVTAKNIGHAIAAFERTLISNNSVFDQYINGMKEVFQPEDIRGLELFKGKAKCISCHSGPNFTDESFHNIGLKGKDKGRGKIVGDKSLNKAFKTPGLRNALLTGPYMHDGSLESLEEVILFYNRGGDEKRGISSLISPLHLTEQEISDLLAFLGTLTDPVFVTPPQIP